VIVSFFESIQNANSLYWDEEEVNAKMERVLMKAFDEVWDASQRHHISLRTAAFSLACERVLVATRDRGLQAC
jgi:glutamate dehydrogenase (NAD(P)+)